MDHPKIDISIIIVNYNVKHFLKQCLQSVYAANHTLQIEVWVVDNNSVDGSLVMLKELFPSVQVIANTKNVGFSKANNQAMEKAKGKYQLILNPDTIIEQDTLIKCFHFMEEHPEAGALGVKMIDGEGKFLPESKRGLPTPKVALYKMTLLNKLLPKSKTFGQYHLGYLPNDKTHQVDVLSGAFMFIRGSVLDKIGYFDETYFMYGEDIDLSYRITKAGYKNYYFPESTIIHYKGESTKKKTFNYVKTFYNAMIIFAKTHYKGGHQKWLVGIISVAIWMRASLALVQRAIERIWVLFVDFIVLFIGFFALAKYWETYNRYVPEYYPDEYFLYHIPAYIVTILFMVKLSGGYQFPFKLHRSQRGVLFGAFLALAVYGILPLHMRFSRAILLLGSLWSLIGITLSRYLVNYFKTRSWSLNSEEQHRIAVLANLKEYERVVNMFALGKKEGQIVGQIAVSQDTSDNSLGDIEQLQDIISIYRISELVFCSKDLDSKQIISWMNKLSKANIKFKIVPANSNFIVGSHSKNNQGELFSIDLQLNISKEENKIKKRLIDILTGILLLLSLPLSILNPKGIFQKVKNGIQLIFAQKTLIGYIDTASNDSLPKLKPGILNPIFNREITLDIEAKERINFLYAKDYSAGIDIQLLSNYSLKLFI
jgi:GT2 family glycosyltransferase